jgi:biopolymer transport protein TolQ
MNSKTVHPLTWCCNASWVVQLVMLLLLAVSISSWAAIFRKLFALKRVKALNETFEREFWSGTSLNDLYASAAQNAKNAGPMERIFASGMREYQKLRERRIRTRHPARRRPPRHARQLPARDGRGGIQPVVPGSVARFLPYVGLFGTVWGIMHAFTGLASMQQVTLATVAPGIAEALVATAIGLFAAIPAVMAYNRFARDIDRVANKQETFIEEFSNILQRNLGAQSASGPPGHCRRFPRVAAPCPPFMVMLAIGHGSRRMIAQRNQHGALHRRDAGAADHLHGDGAAPLWSSAPTAV